MKEMIRNSSVIIKHLPVISVVLGSLLVLAMQLPIQQDLAYHHFADTKALFGIPNFQNVISNLPFILVGLSGVGLCMKRIDDETRISWLLFFAGITLVGFGSIYYHLNPNSQTLLWDRLPMAMGFMAMFAALLGEWMHARLPRVLLFPMVMIGFASVMVWHWFDDLRLYVWVQFMPILVIPVMLLLYPRRYTHTYLLVLSLLIYAVAKIFEMLDVEIFLLLHGGIGGHAIKHVVAAAGSGVILWMLYVRKPLSSADSSMSNLEHRL